MRAKKIKMTRNGVTRLFSPATLTHWPDDYYGWQIVKEDVPEVVAKNLKAASEAPATRGRKPNAKPIQTGDPLDGVELESE